MGAAVHPADDPLVVSLLTRCNFPQPGRPVRCALSGGADSAALTALAVAAGCHVTAVHAHHGLRDDADRDRDAAERIATALDVAFEWVQLDLRDGPNLEARARAQRRAAIGTAALTGHTADDHAETVLLALLRGAGARGLAGIPDGPTHPILRLRRAETRQVCEQLRLEVVDDPSNTDPRFRRNRIRHELLPLIADIAAKDVTENLLRSASLLREDDRYLDTLADALDPTDALALVAAPLSLARRAVRGWLTRDGSPPDAATVARVLDVAAGRALACDVGAGRRVNRTRQRLRLSGASPDGR